MTWDTFTKAIEESELESGTQAQILIKLFKRAGYINRKEDDIPEDTAKKWIKGTRNCKVSTYFPDEEYVQKEKLYQFFRRRPQDRLEKFQQILCKEINASSPIDCITKDMDRFCWGLVNQFLDLLGFQRIDMPTSDLPSDHEFIPDAIESEIDGNVIVEQIPDTFQNEIIHQKDSQSVNQGAQIAIPQECKVCLCCVYWQGDAEAAYKNIDNEYGKCNAFAKRVLAADGVGCGKFKGNYGKIMRYDSYIKYGNSIGRHT
ncbi:MAG: hypothetical protein HDR04_05395 [Lachnospiraceae bacterium]|nr:hypothetical protein [Lachnospiraceae bacterium]